MPCARRAFQTVWFSLRPSGLIGLQQLLELWLAHAVAGDQLYVCDYWLLDRTTAEVRDHRLHAEIAHLHGILDDEAVDMPVAQAFHQSVRCIEADEPCLPGPPAVLQHAQHRQRRRLVGAEDSVNAK